MPVSLPALEKNLGYQFTRQDLFKQALTHRSHGASNNERLEFLGDAILNFVIADALCQQFPTAHEGQLHLLRAFLVRQPTLAEIARELSLGDHLIMGTGELRSGGFNRDSILSDALEAIIAAIFKDSDLEMVREKILSWFNSRLIGLSLESSRKDAKTRLQEFLQGKRADLPEYIVTEIRGTTPNQIFIVECRTELLKETAMGRGGNRRIAEQVAATEALLLLAVPKEGIDG